MSDTTVVESVPAVAPGTAESEALSFRDLNLSPELLEAVERSGYTVPTPIQAGAIPHLLEGRDLLGQAQTGTGKTAAFAIPLLARINLDERSPQVLVLAPTRELAIQVTEAFERYASGLRGLRAACIYGGQDYQVQFRQLDRGVHVVVGTPGRVMDHVRRGSLKLDGLQCLVLDEADEMLRMGFAEDVEWILTQTPAERQIALFSATMPPAIRKIAQQHLRNPAEVTIARKTTTAETIHQRFLVVTPPHKQQAVARILEAEETDGVLIFVKTKSTTEPLAEFLASHGHRTAVLSSDVAQKQRERVVESLRRGKIDVIVATDVAARGLDVQRISHVINYDLPFDSESYVHRIGRTGRAGRSGNAILFIHPKERFRLRRIEQATRQKITPMDIPSNKLINERRIARFHEQITAALASEHLAGFTRVVEQYRAERDVPVEQIAAALAVLAGGERPLLLPDEPKAKKVAEPRPPRSEEAPFIEHMARPRGGKAEGEQAPFKQRRRNEAGGSPTPGMETFRIEVGHAQQIKPGNIVGAITNEIGVDSSLIGRIEIFQEYSTVDMLAGMPREVFNVLKRVRLAGRRLNISRVADGPPERPSFKFKGKKKTKFKGKPVAAKG